MLDKHDRIQEFEPEKSDKLDEIITENDKIIYKKVFKRYFGYGSLSAMREELYVTKAHPQIRL